MAALGTDQDLTQRMLTCRSSTKAARSLIASSVIGIAMAGVFLVIGLLLFVAHTTGAIEPAHDGDTRRVFVDFILSETPAGVRGIMLAGLFAAAMSSLDSALNAMSTSFNSDFRRAGAEDPTLRRSRVMNVAFGFALAGVAIGCAAWQQGSEEGLIPFALGVMVFAYAGLLGVFVAVMFCGRGTAASVTTALAASGCAHSSGAAVASRVVPQRREHHPPVARLADDGGDRGEFQRGASWITEEGEGLWLTAPSANASW